MLAAGVVLVVVHSSGAVVGAPPPQQQQWDLRVSKALGPKGYNMARVSVVTQSVELANKAALMLRAEGGDVYESAFVKKWKWAFDEGCDGGLPYAEYSISYDACLIKCGADSKCGGFFAANQTCHLFSSCAATTRTHTYAAGTRTHTYAAGTRTHTYAAGTRTHTYAAGTRTHTYAATTRTHTYAKVGENRIATAVIELPALGIPAPRPQGESGVRGIILADPCFSSKFMDCHFGDEWDTLNRTVLMLNALASDVDFFAFVGDLFYDKDGTLTRKIWTQLSNEFKSKFLMTVPGNYDFWAGGGPPGDEYDQYGWGYAQFYGQDVLASQDTLFLNFSGGETNDLKNSAKNFLFYHQIGDLGFIGYTGGPAAEAVDSIDWREPCSYFNHTRPRALFLLGHWSDASLGCDSNADTPSLRAKLDALQGCRGLFYFDGHQHCNMIQELDQEYSTPLGFNIGGHGMLPHGCSQYGFALLESDRSAVRLDYFEERNNYTDTFEDIYTCILRHRYNGGIARCRHLADVWLPPASSSSSLSPAAAAAAS